MFSDDVPPLDDFVSLTEDRGVLKKVIKEGHGDNHPVLGETAVVHYVGTYHGGKNHGTKFDSSRDRQELLKFQVGRHEVIKAWDVAIPTMKLGEISEIVAFSDYGYFDDETRRFEVELVDFYGEDIIEDGSILLSITKQGDANKAPEWGRLCTVSLVGTCDQVEFDNRDITFTFGDHESAGIPVGLETAILRLKDGGCGRVKLSNCGSQQSFSDTDYEKRGLRKGATLKYEINVKSCEQRTDFNSLLEFGDKMAFLENTKQEANNFWKSGKRDIALGIYKELERKCCLIITNGIKEMQTLDKFKLSVYLNLALYSLGKKNSSGCIYYLEQGLLLDASNEKCLYRMGQAHMMRGDYEVALTFFERVVKSNPGNKEAVEKVKVCGEVLSNAIRKEKRMFKAAFRRLGEVGHTDNGDSPSDQLAAPDIEATTA